MNSPIVQYCNCMEDVKRRVSVINAIVGGYSPLGSEDFDTEIVCLHMRKLLEQIAFAALSAHKDAYAEVHADFETHWNAKRLLSKLDKIHPEFYPKPVAYSQSDGRGVKQFADVTDGFLTKDEFVFLYDKCSSALHTWNPFKTDPRVINFERPIAEWVLRIQCLLNEHCIRLVGTQDVWLVQMHAADGKVHAYYGKNFPADTPIPDIQHAGAKVTDENAP